MKKAQAAIAIFGIFALLIVSGGLYFISTDRAAASEDPGTDEDRGGGDDSNQSPPVDNNNTQPPSGNSGDPVNTNPDPATMGAVELLLMQTWYGAFMTAAGIPRSTLPSIICDSSGIGCGYEKTSEANDRATGYLCRVGFKELCDLSIKAHYECMEHPQAKWGMWKRSDSCGDAGGGTANMAMDAELLRIEGTRFAERNDWDVDSQGILYSTTRKKTMDALKGAVYEKNGVKYLTHCAYWTGSEGKPCENSVMTGYVSLNTLKYMGSIDSYWTSVYNDMKDVMIEAATRNPGTIHTRIYLDNNDWQHSMGDLHQIWAIERLVEDGGSDTWAAVEPYYTEARTRFMADYAVGKAGICKEFINGCVFTGGPGLHIYALWAETACARGDVQFGQALVNVMKEKLKYEDAEWNGEKLYTGWNANNIFALEAFAQCRAAGVIVG